METTLRDAGIHEGTVSGVSPSGGSGHYEAHLDSDNGLIITTVYDAGTHKPTVKLSAVEWDRLVAWVEWQRRDTMVGSSRSK